MVNQSVFEVQIPIFQDTINVSVQKTDERQKPENLVNIYGVFFREELLVAEPSAAPVFLQKCFLLLLANLLILTMVH